MSFFSGIANALNPVNQAKALWGVATNPLNPMKQTNAMLNLFRPGGGSPSRQPPPGYYPAPAMSPGYGAPPPGYGPPPGYPPAAPMPPPGYPPMPPQQWGGMPAPPPIPPMGYPQAPPGNWDTSQFMAQDFGGDTGWDAAYGGSGEGW